MFRMTFAHKATQEMIDWKLQMKKIVPKQKYPRKLTLVYSKQYDTRCGYIGVNGLPAKYQVDPKRPHVAKNRTKMLQS